MVTVHPIANRVNIEVAWSRDEVLVGIVLLVITTHACSLAYWCCVLVDHLEWHVPPHSCSSLWLGQESWEIEHRVRGAQCGGLDHGTDVGEVHIPACLRCCPEPF